MGSKKLSKSLKAGILQFRPKLREVSANLKAIETFLGRRKFDLMVLPELATTGYNFRDRADALAVADKKGGPSFAVFERLAEKTGGAIVWGMAEKAGNKLYNSAVLTVPEGDHFLYRKTHLFFREKEVFDPGNTGFKVFDWRGVRIGLMICFDWIFPEAARTLALKKAQVICHPSNLVMQFCQDAMVTRSIENKVFCLTANRIGTEKTGGISLSFTGKSQITDPGGRRILSFSKTEQGVKAVKFAPQTADMKNVNMYNNIVVDRRVGYYQIQSGTKT